MAKCKKYTLKTKQKGFNKTKKSIFFVQKETYKFFCLIFAKKLKMATTKKNTGLYWILFILSVVGFFAVLYSPIGAYCSMVLPFNVTFFAKALDLM
jgi:hypothetical protein